MHLGTLSSPRKELWNVKPRTGPHRRTNDQPSCSNWILKVREFFRYSLTPARQILSPRLSGYPIEPLSVFLEGSPKVFPCRGTTRCARSLLFPASPQPPPSRPFILRASRIKAPYRAAKCKAFHMACQVPL